MRLTCPNCGDENEYDTSHARCECGCEFEDGGIFAIYSDCPECGEEYEIEPFMDTYCDACGWEG